MNALISVIIPVYNTAPWLVRCLDSICTQTYRNLEILCVNDGSTDNSAEILAEYAAKDSRIKVFTQKNAGLSAARNTALEHATGEWVTGLDSDDYLAADALGNAIKYMADGVDAVCMQIQLVSENGVDLPDMTGYYELSAGEISDMTPELAERLNVCFAGKLWHRRLLEENNLRFPHGLVHEDEALYYLVMPCIRKIAFSSGIGYYYVQRSQSIMHGEVSFGSRLSRTTAVLAYVFREYEMRGWPVDKSPYLQVMMRRLYTSLYHLTGKSGYALIQNVFYCMARKEGMHRLWAGDYRFRRMRPVSWWLRPFLERYLNCELVRFFGLPLCVLHYGDDGSLVSREWILWRNFKKLSGGS